MRKVSGRARAVLLLAVLVLAGLAVFFVQYLFQAGNWVTFAGSPHVYTGNNLTTGTIRDRNGQLLLDNQDGKRSYSPDESVRKATLHLLGDRYGYIPSPMLSSYADQMAGFNPVQGVYGSEGGNMTLTISAAANTTAYEAMNGRHGCVAVYNYQTGEILCLLSSPTYDPDHMPDVEGDTTGQYDGVYVNRPVAATYTPGSIFKLVTMVAAIEHLPDWQSQTYSCNGVATIGGQEVHCLNVHGTVDLSTALAKSCNVAFGELAVQLGAEVLTETAERLGLTDSLSFDGLRTAPGSFDLTEAEDWELAWAGIGQYTDLVNPLQFLSFVGAIANGGQAAQPYLVASVDGNYAAKTVLLERSMETTTAEQLAARMVNNVQTVYGSWNFPGVTVGAKSGTAEQEGSLPHATFAGFIQDERYPLAFVVVVENAGSGSETCIPIVNAVLSQLLQELDGNELKIDR